MSARCLRQRACGPHHYQRGLTLVEVMVALTLGLFLLGGVSAIYLFTGQSTRSSALQAQMNEDAALALEVLGQQLRLAGFSTDRPPPNGDERQFKGLALRGCDGGFSNAHNNSNTANFDDLACSASTSGPDALAVRYEATVLNAHTVTLASGAVAPVNCVFEGISAWALSATAPSMALAENRFYIGPDPANDDVPSLRCRGREGSGFSNVGTVVPNIEDLQMLYAVTRLPDADEPLPQQVTAYRNAQDIDQWSRVMGARVCVVARTSARVPDLPVELRQYVNCAGQRVTAPADGMMRRAYTVTVMARNLRPGLAAPFATGSNPWAAEDSGG